MNSVRPKPNQLNYSQTSKRSKTKVIVQVFSHDVTAAILMFQNNEAAAMLVYQTNPVRVELFSYVNHFPLAAGLMSGNALLPDYC